MLCDDLEGWDGAGGGSRGMRCEAMDGCIYMADALHCRVETNTTL